ncbi:MAG: DNA-binding protein [Bacteroidales bacterium]|nr:DNA-binding protein [Bacteroidales bacterium]
MKLRYIFTALAAAALAFVGCQEEERFLDEVQVDKSIVAIPVEGGQDQITVTATAEWVLEMPEEAWFNVDLVSGAAGKTVVTFSAEATADTREVNVNLVCAGAKQAIKVLQMAKKVETPLSTCAEANAGETGKVYRVKGTVTSIANDLYGNMYITDETGTVYVYGTLYQGAEKQFSKHGIEVGDIVTVEGPQSPYNGSPQLKNVTVIEIEKSLIKLEKLISTPLPLEGGVVTALLTVKGGEFSVEIPEDAAWLTAGEPSDLGGVTCVELTAAANEGGARKTTVTFKTIVDGKDYIAMADVEQAGAIKAVTVAEFLAAAEGTSLYELTGVVKNIKNTTYGNFDIVDATGSVYVYGLTNNGAVGSNDKTFASLGINEGDKVTIVGTRTSYSGTAQVGGTAYLVAHTAAQAATIAEFLAAPVSADKWYKLTGTIESIVKEEYGNFYLTDGTSRVYVYGVTAAPVAKNDKSFPSLGVKAGDKITIVGTRAQYASSSVEDQKEQVGGPAYYVSHEAATEPDTPAEPEPETPAATTLTLTNAEICAAMTSSETSYVDYTIESASGVWTVNASRNNANTFLQCRGKKGAYIKTPTFEQDIKSVTIHFSEAKQVYANNVYCVFPSTWTAPTADAAYPEDGNVGKATTDGSYSLTIPVNAGNKQVYVSIISTYAYYLDHIDVNF